MAIAAAGAWSMPAHAGNGSVDFLVEPMPGSQTADRGGYFVVDAARGARVRQRIALRNDSARPLDLRLRAVDALTGALGGASYGLPGEPRRATGRWISIDAPHVRLAPQATRVVPFTVSVPRDARSGEHLAGIAVWAPRRTPRGRDDAVASVHVQTRRVVAVQVDVPGPKTPRLVISGVDTAARPDGLYLEIGVSNRGTAMTTGTGVVTLPDEDFEREFVVDTFVPATSIRYPVSWTDRARTGEYRASVRIRYDGGVARWSGTFTVGDGVIEELQRRGATHADESQVPLAVAVAAGASVLAGTAWWLARRKRRGSRAMGTSGAA